MTTKIEIVIASLPDRDNLVAELWCENKQLGELSQEHENLILELYPNSSQNSWIFRLDEILEVLEQAKYKLLDSSNDS
jgi:hypothetical protein